MRHCRWFALLFLFCLAGAASAQNSSNVRVTWIGQSGFLIQTENGPAVISDPAPASFGFLFPTTPADAVTVSHTHTDHTGTTLVQGTPALVDGRNVTERREQTAAGMLFTIIPGFHDAMGATRNSLITWTQGGLRFLQGGDYGQTTLTDAQMADLRNIDVAFIGAANPVFTPAVAKAFIDQFRPRIAILCHYRTPLGGAAGLATFRDFSALYPNPVFQYSTVTLNKDRLPAQPEVWVMQPSANAAVVNAASFIAGAPLAPGSLASLFGNFTNAATVVAQGSPLPTTLGNVEVVVNGRSAPLLYVSPTQINFQVSHRLETPNQVLVEIKVAGATVARTQLTAFAGAPGIFTATDVNYRPVSAATPIKRGEALVIWATGHGELTDAIEDGQPAAGLINTKTKPRVTIGGVEAELLFSGLSPGLAGVWQINAIVPANAPTGTGVPLVVTQGQTSNALPLAISEAAIAPEQNSSAWLRGWRDLLSWVAGARW
jgi:uncharacterized protein (TIGR03437 family)